MAELTVSRITVLPEVFTPGDTITVHVSLKNTTGHAIGSVGVTLYFSHEGVRYTLRCGQTARVSIAKNASAVLTFTQVLSGGAAVNLTRVLAETRGVVLESASVTADETEHTVVPLTDYVRAVDRLRLPAVEAWTAERCDVSGGADDEGTFARCDLRLSANDAEGLTLTVSDGTVVRDVTARIGEAMTGIAEDASLFPEPLPNTEKHTLTVRFGDAFEWAERSAELPRAFANLHLSGAVNGGACFGGFSASTDDAPLFECRYPALFYGGMKVDKVAVPVYAGGFKAYGGHEPRVVRIGGMIFLDGMMSPSRNVTPENSEGTVMATLPEWARPRVRVNQLMQGSSAAVWWMMIVPETNGKCTVRIARYRQTNSTSYAGVSTDNQLPVSCMWIAADAYPADEE